MVRTGSEGGDLREGRGPLIEQEGWTEVSFVSLLGHCFAWCPIMHLGLHQRSYMKKPSGSRRNVAKFQVKVQY